MIRNKAYIFLTLITFALTTSDTLFASAASAGASAATSATAATAAPAAAQSMSTLANIDAHLSHIAGIGASTVKIGAMVAAPVCIYYGGKALLARWSKSDAIKADTESILAGQESQGNMLKAQGRQLDVVSKKVRNIEGDVKAIKEGQTEYQKIQARAAETAHGLLKALGVRVDTVETQVRANGVKLDALSAKVDANEDARKQDAERAQMQMEDMNGLIAQLTAQQAKTHAAAIAAKTAADAAAKHGAENAKAIEVVRTESAAAHKATHNALDQLRMQMAGNHAASQKAIQGVPKATAQQLVTDATNSILRMPNFGTSGTARRQSSPNGTADIN